MRDYGPQESFPSVGRLMEPAEKNLGRYANHSCRPNAETHIIGHRVIIRALKNIRPSVEIAYNYGRDYLTNVITRRGCKCDKCRKKRADGRVKARTKRPIQTQARPALVARSTNEVQEPRTHGEMRGREGQEKRRERPARACGRRAARDRLPF